jgi:hypothetical protein
MARTMGAGLPVTVSPLASCTVTTGCVGNAPVATAPVGDVVNASFTAALDVMLKGLLVAVASVPLVAVKV